MLFDISACCIFVHVNRGLLLTICLRSSIFIMFFFGIASPHAEINGVGAQINLQQVQALVAAANGHQSIIAGDLNTSPDLPSIGVSGLFEPSYQYALSQYLSSPYVNNTGSMCTFCTDNPILDLMATSSNITYLSTILDHVLVNRQVFNVDEKSIKVRIMLLLLWMTSGMLPGPPRATCPVWVMAEHTQMKFHVQQLCHIPRTSVVSFLHMPMAPSPLLCFCYGISCQMCAEVHITMD